MLEIWKIKFCKNSSELDDDYIKLSEFQKNQLVDLNNHGFLDYDYENKYTCLLITDFFQIKAYQRILKDNLIVHCVSNISKEILTGEFDVKSEIESHVNIIRGINFMKKINVWALKNLDIDIVLDRISKVGIDGLNSYEKEFLKQYKH